MVFRQPDRVERVIGDVGDLQRAPVVRGPGPGAPRRVAQVEEDADVDGHPTVYPGPLVTDASARSEAICVAREMTLGVRFIVRFHHLRPPMVAPRTSPQCSPLRRT